MNLVPDWRDSQLKVRVIGKQRLACRGMCAAHHPIIAAKSLANFILRYLREILKRLRESRGQIGGTLMLMGATRSPKLRFEHRVGLHIVIVIIIVAVRRGALRAVIDNLRIADD